MPATRTPVSASASARPDSGAAAGRGDSRSTSRATRCSRSRRAATRVSRRQRPGRDVAREFGRAVSIDGQRRGLRVDDRPRPGEQRRHEEQQRTGDEQHRRHRERDHGERPSIRSRARTSSSGSASSSARRRARVRYASTASAATAMRNGPTHEERGRRRHRRPVEDEVPVPGHHVVANIGVGLAGRDHRPDLTLQVVGERRVRVADRLVLANEAA